MVFTWDALSLQMENNDVKASCEASCSSENQIPCFKAGCAADPIPLSNTTVSKP